MWNQQSTFTYWCREQLREFIAAIRFISTLPTPGIERLFQTEDTEAPLLIGSAYFPVVGFIIALLLCILVWLLGPHIPQLLLAALLIVAHVLLTGGLHLDGLIDTCDGLFGGTGQEKKLEIMRDSRTGSFGVLGAICVLLLKFAIFASVNIHMLPVMLLVVLPVARWAIVMAVYVFPSARNTGLGLIFRQTVTRERVLAAGIIAIMLALIFGHVAGVLVWMGGTLTALGLGVWATRHLRGLTGDVDGAIEEITEVVSFLLFMLFAFLS